MKDDNPNLDGVQQAERTTLRIIERALPLVERLKAVHHGAVIAVRGGGDEEEDDPRVEDDQPM